MQQEPITIAQAVLSTIPVTNAIHRRFWEIRGAALWAICVGHRDWARLRDPIGMVAW